MSRRLLFLVLASLTGWPQTKDNRYFTSAQANGYLWATMDDANKISFVVGMNSGGEVLEIWALGDLPVCLDKTKGLKIRHQDSPELIKVTDLPPITNPGGHP